jgi:hypothetical protein
MQQKVIAETRFLTKTRPLEKKKFLNDADARKGKKGKEERRVKG